MLDVSLAPVIVCDQLHYIRDEVTISFQAAKFGMAVDRRGRDRTHEVHMTAPGYSIQFKTIRPACVETSQKTL